MPLITADYLEANARAHADDAGWGRGGAAYGPTLAALLDVHVGPMGDVLDYGCGKGGMVGYLQGAGYYVQGYDPAVECWSTPPVAEVDFLYSLDVLEHVEPACLQDVLGHVAWLARAAFFVISTCPAQKVFPDGNNAHLIVEGADWWAAALAGHYAQVRALPALHADEAVFLCQR